eukprot:Gregarina_sp_Pseudo_9__363@NODE_1234_length_1755_cov_65_956876_g1160_i0_p1_GENE_NODE_1234_length_1755_cov_65_956876_g1160_i0NODE_1234_length_1755_cov_65_956876_g1160_i0_p1_ORF_typecomplete_len498_score85_12Redoxin/PF08534_10/5_6e11Redoxin/PF08534_10/49AhpCTSA/PF00578_21/0_00089AhpCTSA/PF00578_21/8e03_NODE_1234_length_1755_cov_65_956876_g1160_i0561549
MLKPGDAFPSTCIGLKNRDVDLRDRFLESAGLLIGSIGAFHPVDTTRLIPGYREAAERLKENGVAFIACLAVNDPFVLRAWARRMKIVTELTFISDVNALLSQALGMDRLMPSDGFGNVLPRCQRFAMLVGKGATVLAVGVDDEAFSDRFLPRVLEIMGNDESGALKPHQRLSVRQISDVSSKSLASARRPIPPQLSCAAETWYPEKWLLNFHLLYRNCINDTDNEHISFNYSASSLCDSYMLKRKGPYLELSPDSDDDFGSVMIDYMRPVRAKRRMGLATSDEVISDEPSDLEYNITRVIVTAQHGLTIETPVNSNLYASYNYGIGITGGLVIVIHEIALDEDRGGRGAVTPAGATKYLVTVFGLFPGGRDPLLANIQHLLPLEHNQEIKVERSSLSEEDQGLGISHYVAARDKFYSFKAKLPFLHEDGTGATADSEESPLAIWFIAAEKAYASEEQLRALRSLFEAAGTQPSGNLPPADNTTAPELMFFTACDCQ